MGLYKNAELTFDRFNNSNNSLKLNNSHATVPPGDYFDRNFTITEWVKVNEIASYSRFLDFGNGAESNNVVLSFSFVMPGKPLLHLHVSSNLTKRLKH